MKKTLKILLREQLLKEQNNINPEVEKFYKESKMKIWFMENVVDKVKEITKPEYSDKIFYADKDTGEEYMAYNKKSNILWINSSKIWAYFEKNYSDNYEEIKQLIKDLMGEHYNLWDVSPNLILYN